MLCDAAGEAVPLYTSAEAARQAAVDVNDRALRNARGARRFRAPLLAEVARVEPGDLSALLAALRKVGRIESVTVDGGAPVPIAVGVLAFGLSGGVSRTYPGGVATNPCRTPERGRPCPVTSTPLTTVRACASRWSPRSCSAAPTSSGRSTEQGTGRPAGGVAPILFGVPLADEDYEAFPGEVESRTRVTVCIPDNGRGGMISTPHAAPAAI